MVWQAVPYLNEAPAAAVSLDLVPVSNLMASPVVSFQERMPASLLRRALRDTTHNGFPVVRETPRGEVHPLLSLLNPLRNHPC